jgi:NAD-specific glutamate dehydrogenase
MAKKKSSQWKDYKTYKLSDGSKFLARDDSDAKLYRQKVGDEG